MTDRSARAALDVRRGKHLLRFRKIEAAEAVIRDALRAFEAARDHHGMAVAYGEIANITEERGKRDEALRILQTEVLPVFDRLGDMQSRAATMGRIADILDARGEADEALRIREDLLPVFERLGDARSRAITKGHIADILRKRGRLDEATRILREEVLPVFERVGDERSRSVVLLRIAMTLFQMEGIESGRTREIIAALQESLRIAVKLGEPSGIAPAGQLLATVLATDGQPLAFDVAIETLDATETVLRKLGDVKGVREIRSISDISQEVPPPRRQEGGKVMTKSFVPSLKIAHDDRLIPPPVRRAKGMAATRGDKFERADVPEAPPAIRDNLRAAVNAGSILSFVTGLSAEEIVDVLYSTQIAQRAASAKHDRFAATEDWYGSYVDVLERLGWVGEAFAFSEAKSASGKLQMDRAALDVIQAIASGGQLAILVKTMETLKKLGKNDRPLRIFDIQARQDLSGNFQIGAAQKGDNGAVSVALGAFRFRVSDNRGVFLFFGWGAEEVKFWTAVRKMTLNRDLYAVHRAAVIAKLKADAANYVDELSIK